MNLPERKDSSIRWGTGRTPMYLALVFLIGFCTSASAANVVILSGPVRQSFSMKQIETAAEFYGLSVEEHDVIQENKSYLTLLAKTPDLLAVEIEADSLPMVDREQLLSLLKRRHAAVSVMICGITSGTDSAVLAAWSDGAIIGGGTTQDLPNEASYTFAGGSEVTGPLAGIRLPLNPARLNYLRIKPGASPKPLMMADVGRGTVPVLASVENAGPRQFYSALTHPLSPAPAADPYREQAVFSDLAPAMLFLRYAAGKRGWHSPGSYANFTIDDLWLREPYGHVQYEELLRQAQTHDFHATIAFIPWNFDRSDPAVVRLFRDHPDRLSICVHGNNHIHQEFGEYATHPLEKQTADLKQALARMNRFRQLTGLPFDKVMVFPHSVSQDATFAELKRLNYLATANSLSVPSDAEAPDGAEFALRTASLQFANFPSLRRYSAEPGVPEAQLAIDAFLGNPMLFYAHEGFFANGIGEFNKTADVVNRLSPHTKWSGLGEISHHLYLERQREDGSYDIRAYSSEIELTNTHGQDATFYLEKDENFALPVTLTVDREPAAFERRANTLVTRLEIPPGVSRTIQITYRNDFNPDTTAIAKDSYGIYLIRWLSDFRDIAVSRSRVGRRFIRSYAEFGAIWNLSVAFASVIVILGFTIRHMRRRQLEARRGPRSQPMFSR